MNDRVRSMILLSAVAAAFTSAAAPSQKTAPINRPPDPLEFMGRLEPVRCVHVRSPVDGPIVDVLFREGAEVKGGDALFRIDPRPYEARVDLARARLAGAEARLQGARLRRERAVAAGQAAGRDELDQATVANLEAQADVVAANSTLALRRMDLEGCNVLAPFSGRAGVSLATRGTLCNRHGSALVEIVSVDPIRVAFDVDERTFLAVARRANDDGTTALFKLSSETTFSRRATLEFVDNRFDSRTGTIRLRALAPNPPGPDGASLVPGMVVSVRLILPGGDK